MAKADPGSQVERIDPNRFPALVGDANSVIDALRVNLGGERLSERDLTQIQLPGGGSVTWEIPGLTGTVETKSLEGVVVFTRNTRAYWAKDLDAADRQPEDAIPACASKDAITGIGDPGGSCERCPLSQFGSGKGNGQACKQMRQLFLVREQGLLPFVVTLPPTSLKPARDYLLALAREGHTYLGVVTAITLERKTANGQNWAEARFAYAGTLEPEVAAQTRAYSEAMGAVFAGMSVVDTPEAEPENTEPGAQAFADDDPAAGF